MGGGQARPGSPRVGSADGGCENYATVDWVVSWDDLVSRGRTALPMIPPSSIDPRRWSPRMIWRRSSIRRAPPDSQGVMISHRNIVWTCECLSRAVEGVPDHSRVVSYLPLAHIGERMATHYTGLWRVGSVSYVSGISAVAEAVQRARPQVFFAVPRVWEKFEAGLMARLEAEPDERRRKLALAAVELATESKKAEQAGGSVRLVDKAKLALFDRLVFSKIRAGLGLDDLSVAISAAAPVSADLLMFFQGIGLPVYEMFGMTESSGPGATNREGPTRSAPSVGRCQAWRS